MAAVHPETMTVARRDGTTGTSTFLDPFHIFKGKLGAAATRSKFHDSADLRWLESHCAAQITARKNELSLESVGLAIKRYPELERMFKRLGIDVDTAKSMVSGASLNAVRSGVGDVQKRLLG